MISSPPLFFEENQRTHVVKLYHSAVSVWTVNYLSALKQGSKSIPTGSYYAAPYLPSCCFLFSFRRLRAHRGGGVPPRRLELSALASPCPDNPEEHEEILKERLVAADEDSDPISQHNWSLYAFTHGLCETQALHPALAVFITMCAKAF